MSSTTNTDQSHERRDEKTLCLTSPFRNEIESFENEGSFPDLDFFVEGKERPLRLHKKILAQSSDKMRDIFLLHQQENVFHWKYDTRNTVDQEALVKALRFCYGETQTVGTKNGECCAVIAALTRLHINNMDEIVATLSNFAVEEARRDIFVGVELLMACARYKECCGMDKCTLNQDLAKIVLSKENMSQHFREVVDECLMLLPQDFLELAEFSEPHTTCSEFRLRVRYMRDNPTVMTYEEKQAILKQCDLSTLNSDELRELRLLDILDKDQLLRAYEKALEYCEIEKARANDRAEQFEKEKDAKVKQAERDRDEKVQQANREKEEYQRQLATMQALTRGNRLLEFFDNHMLRFMI